MYLSALKLLLLLISSARQASSNSNVAMDDPGLMLALTTTTRTVLAIMSQSLATLMAVHKLSPVTMRQRMQALWRV
uniref:Putative secreted protein n=1 Tax=Ixodes ricinus TaxID=34613 RepID=A0A6B0U3X4_IXORI